MDPLETALPKMNDSMKDLKVPIDYADRNVCILGLGFVGLTLATVMADVGFQVTGIEIRDELLDLIASGNAHFFEPGLSSKLQKVLSSKNLQVQKNLSADDRSTVYIITAGTPLDENKNIVLGNIKKISADIAECLKDGDLVILRSTVKLGTTRSIVLPILQKSNKRFQIAFCPERTVEGQAMAELRYLPQIIGADILDTGIRAAQLFQFITPTVVRVNNLETAEMIKLIDNTKRDVIFGFSNEVAHLCDVAGLSADEVINAGRFGYSRTDLPTPGPVGGPCLSKDSHILVQSMMEYGVVPEIIKAARNVNEQQSIIVVEFLKKFLSSLKDFPKKPIISLLGIAFKGKPATDDIRGSTAKCILEDLKSVLPDATFLGYDPVVKPNVIQEFGLSPQKEAEEAFRNASLVLILNNHPFFASMAIETWALSMARPGIIYDFWNNFRNENLCLPEGIQYVALGSHKYAK